LNRNKTGENEKKSPDYVEHKKLQKTTLIEEIQRPSIRKKLKRQKIITIIETTQKLKQKQPFVH